MLWGGLSLQMTQRSDLQGHSISYDSHFSCLLEFGVGEFCIPPANLAALLSITSQYDGQSLIEHLMLPKVYELLYCSHHSCLFPRILRIAKTFDFITPILRRAQVWGSLDRTSFFEDNVLLELRYRSKAN